MDVRGLLGALGALPAARAVPPVAPFDTILVVAGIEVAHTGATGDQALRRLWRDRHRGGATPLLLEPMDADDIGVVCWMALLGDGLDG